MMVSTTKDYLGSQQNPLNSVPTKKAMTSIETIEAANREAIAFTHRVERVVAALCGALPAEGEACGSEERPNGVFPNLKEQALSVSNRIRSAGFELERLEALVDDRG